MASYYLPQLIVLLSEENLVQLLSAQGMVLYLKLYQVLQSGMCISGAVAAIAVTITWMEDTMLKLRY